MTGFRKEIAGYAKNRGWTAAMTRGGHIRFQHTSPGVGPVFAPSTPSDWRALKNTQAALRRAERSGQVRRFTSIKGAR